MPQNTSVVAVTMRSTFLYYLLVSAIAVLGHAVPLSQQNDGLHNTAKVPFIEKSPASPQLNLERPQLVDRPEPDSFKEAPPRNQLRPEPVFTGNRDDIQRPQIIYIKNALAHEPNGRPQLPHVEGVRRRYRFDDIPDFRQGQWWNERPQISQEYERDMEQKKSSAEQTVSSSSVKPILELPPPTRKPIEVTKPPRRLPSCLYSGRRYEHSSPVKTPEPCLNCTCQAGVLVCYLRVCPAVISVPEGCFAAREPGQCCATAICNNAASNGEISNEVNSSEKKDGNEDEDTTSVATSVDRNSLSAEASTNPLSPPTVDEKQTDFVLDEQAVTLVPDESFMSRRLDSPIVVTSSPKLVSSSAPTSPQVDRGSLLARACFANDAWFTEGSAMISHAQCVYCYCLRGRKQCARPSCALAMPGCVPQYGSSFDCCPTNYVCQSTPFSTTSTTTTTVETPAGCVHEGQSYELGSVLPSEACKTCVCTPKGVVCATVECPLAAVGCSGIIPEGHCCPTEYVCDKIRNMKNETEQLKIIPDPRPGSFKETHLFRRIDGDSFEAYLNGTTETPRTTMESNRTTRGESHDENTGSSSPDGIPAIAKQVIVNTDGVDLSNSEASNLFYVPETLLEPTTDSPMSPATESPEGIETSASLPALGVRTIESSRSRSAQESNLSEMEPPKERNSSSDASQNYLRPVYVPENHIKKLDHAESLLEEKNQGSTTMEHLGASPSTDSLDVLEPLAMASTTVSTFAAFPDTDTDTKLSKYSNNNSNSKKKSTFTVNLGSHITVAYDSAEVTTEDGITTAKNSEFNQLAETEDPSWKGSPPPPSTTTTTELPRPSPHIFTLQEKQDHMTPTEASLKLTRKQGDDITTIPGLIISTPSTLLRTDELAKDAKPPSSSVPPYIITTSDVINNEVKFHPSQRPAPTEETFSTEFGLRKTDVEPTVQSSSPSKSIYRTAAAAGTATTAAASSAAAPPLSAATTNAFDERARKRPPPPHQPEVGSPLTNEDPTKKFNAAQRPVGNINFAEGIKIFSTLLLSGLAKTRSDQSTASPTGPAVFYDSVTEKFPDVNRYSSPAPISLTRTPLNNARSTTPPSSPASQLFISNIPLNFNANENGSTASKQPSSKTPQANRIAPGWLTLSNHHGERLGNKPTTPQQSVLSFVANDALLLPHGHPSATNQTIPSKGSGCFINGVTVADGELIPKEDPCVVCRCHRGEELCTVKKCPAPPSEDCLQERLDGTCCPRYTCKLDPARVPTRVSHRRIVDDGFHQPNHPKYVPHIDIMIAPQNPKIGARIVDRPNSKQEYISLEGVGRSPASSKKLSDPDESKLRSSYRAATEEPLDTKIRMKGSSDSDYTTIPTATLKALIQHAANHLPANTVTLSPSMESKTFTNTESPLARSLFKVLSDKQNTPHSNAVPFGTVSTPKNSPILHDFVTENQPQSASSSVWNLLKVSGCNIYGKYYRVNEVVTELTERCKVCTCTAIGVHCIHTC